MAGPYAQLGPKDVHVDANLTGYVQTDYNASQALIWEKIAPRIVVNKESDKFSRHLTDLRHYHTLRADGTPAHIVSVAYGSDTYSVEEYAAASFLTDRTRDNADDVLKLRQRLTMKAKQVVMTDLEIRVRDLAQACANTTAVSVAWDSTTNTPDPEKDIDTAKYTILGRIGVQPNRIKLSLKAIWALDRYLKAAANIPEAASLAKKLDAITELWGLEPVVVFSQLDTANLQDASSLSQIWTETEAIVYYADTDPTLESQGWMQTFVKKRTGGGMSMSERVRTWYDDKVESEFFEYSIMADPKVTESKAAQKLTSVIS